MKCFLPQFLFTLLPFYLFTFFCACTSDAYEKGTGTYSLMRTDLAEATIDGEKYAVSLVTDEGDSYTLSPKYQGKWIQTADTTYRVIAYYNPHDDGTAEAVAFGVVPTLIPREQWKFKTQPQDPVGVESAWVSTNGKYLNMALLVKSGHTDDEDASHIIALAQDTVITHADQRRTAIYRLLHDQGNVPEYYTNRHYVSILLPEDRPDTVTLTIQTYDGTLSRQFPIQRH